MAELLIKNQEMESNIFSRDLSSITDDLIYGRVDVPNVDIQAISNSRTYYYSSNNLVITLNGEGATFANPNVRVNGFWKVSNSEPTEFKNYAKFETDADVILFSSNRIIININDSDETLVENYFSSRGIVKPVYGFLILVLNFQSPSGNVREYAYIIKYTHNPVYSRDILSVPIPTGSLINRYTSSPYSVETLFVPTISGSFVYNFYEPTETDYEVYKQRDYRTRAIDSIPKYNKLNWDKPNFNISSLYPSRVFLIPSGSRFLDFEDSSEEAVFVGPSTRENSTSTISSEERSEGSAFRFGGIILSREIASELASVMTLGGRSADDAAETFDGIVSESTSVERALNGTEDLDLENPTVRSGLDTIVDDFATYIPTQESELTIGTTTDYIGYVIQKFRLNELGDFEPIDLIAIKGVNSLEYIDWKIAYGEVYSYKIRSVFRFVNKDNLSMFGDSNLLINRNQTSRFVDSHDFLTNKTYYFDSINSNRIEIQTTEEVRPDSPSAIKMFSNSFKKKIFITWNQKFQNRDVVGFNVYRKRKDVVDDFFIRLNSDTIDIRNNFYSDFDIEFDVEYIYAIESIDFHGNFSKLSAQYYLKIKEPTNFIDFCESKQEFWDWEGREIGDDKPKEDKDLIVVRNNFNLNINPLFSSPDENKIFVVKITSLDTGMEKEIKLNFKQYTNYHVAPYVPREENTFRFLDFIRSGAFSGTLGFRRI